MAMEEKGRGGRKPEGEALSWEQKYNQDPPSRWGRKPGSAATIMSRTLCHSDTEQQLWEWQAEEMED